MGNEALAKLLIIGGGAIVAVGLILLALSKLGITRLPGDIHLQGDRWSLTFPLVTCLLISLILTVLANLLLRR